MELKIMKPQTVNAKIIRVHVKTSDRLSARVYSDKGELLKDHDGYTPGFFPEGGGDYLVLNIDIDTGVIVNWVKPTAEVMEEFINYDLP